MHRIDHALLSPSLGSHKSLTSFHFGRAGAGPKIYIQASLHAEELPGMLAAHHLRPLLEAADAAGQVAGEVVLVPVLRAGLGMLDTILPLVPHARVGFIGLKREESTLRAAFYHKSLPADLRQFEVILIDPMLATGGSAVAAMDLLREHHARRVRLVSLVAAPEGIQHLRRHYPTLTIFTAAVDRELNEKGYILPGLGDAGDRLFGV